MGENLLVRVSEVGRAHVLHQDTKRLIEQLQQLHCFVLMKVGDDQIAKDLYSTGVKYE